MYQTNKEKIEAIRNWAKGRTVPATKESKIEIAKSVLENHVDIEIIAKSTGLEIEKIKEL